MLSLEKVYINRVQQQKNLLLLRGEAFITALLNSAQSFFQLYALRLGATDTEIGLLTSIPALAAILLSFPIGRFLQSRSNPKPWIFSSFVMNRLCLSLLVLVPFIHPVGKLTQGSLVIAVMILAGIPLLVFNNGIYPILMSLLPGERWAEMFATRNIIMLLTTALGVYLLGRWLAGSSFPNNYQWMISLALTVSLASLFFWLKTRPYNLRSPTPNSPTEAPLRTRFLVLEDLSYRTDLGRVIFNQILQYVGIWTVTPLYILYMVNILGANESWIGLNTTVVSICALVGSLLASWVIRKHGEPWVLKRFSQVTSLYPILLGLSTSLTPVLFVGALNNLLSPSYSLSHNNNLLGSIPRGKEHVGIAVYNILTSMCTFILPLIGITLANRFGIRQVLIAGGLLSLSGSLSFWIWPVRGEWRNIYVETEGNQDGSQPATSGTI